MLCKEMKQSPGSEELLPERKKTLWQPYCQTEIFSSLITVVKECIAKINYCSTNMLRYEF
jgi:hypothetical protein